MKRELTLVLMCIGLAGATALLSGCESSASSTAPSGALTPAEPMNPPVREKAADVNVDIGNGRGINIDVDRKAGVGRDADVDVDVGGPAGGIRVDVDR